MLKMLPCQIEALDREEVRGVIINNPHQVFEIL
jgi:hypothetical protein